LPFSFNYYLCGKNKKIFVSDAKSMIIPIKKSIQVSINTNCQSNAIVLICLIWVFVISLADGVG